MLCAPLGIEALCAYFTFRVLADRLARRGLAVLRFDYDGTGDSSGDQDDPHRVPAWLGSVTAAVDLMSGLGLDSLGLVGMRMGALFGAKEAVRRAGVDALVLWDPCASGKAFLREQRAYRMVSLGGEDHDGAVEAPGVRFDAATAGDLSGLDLAGLEGSLADRLLVLEHPERLRPRRLVRRLDGLDVEWAAAVRQGELLDPPVQRPAYESIEVVTAWVDRAMAGADVAVAAPRTAPVVVARTASGAEIVERQIAIGPHRLFGIVTEPSAPAHGPAIVFVDEGNTPHIGQSRMWVDLARSWAEAGLRVLRFDLSGNGDSEVRPGQQPHLVRAPEAVDDVLDAAHAVSPGDPSDVVLVGLCAGAYQSMEMALANHVRGICVVNPFVTFRPPEGWKASGFPRRQAMQSSKRWFATLARVPVAIVARFTASDDADDWATALDTGSWPVAVASRHPWIPAFVWRVVDRLLLDNTQCATFERLVASGVEVFVICGEPDLPPVTLGADVTLKRLRRSDRFGLAMLDGLDHAALLTEQRLRLKRALTDHVVTSYGPDRSDGGVLRPGRRDTVVD